MELKEYSNPNPLTLEATTERDDTQTFIKITRLHREASHVLIFKGKRGGFGMPDIMTLGEPVFICDGFDLLRRRDGRVNIGQTVTEYYAVPAKLTDGIYYYDKRSIKKVEAGEYTAVQYILIRDRQTQDCDRLTISFAPMLKGGAGTVPYDSLFYSVDGMGSIKYPINPKLVKDGAFTVYVPANRNVQIVSAEGAHIRATLIK
ncbi:MAG: hypothetical protein FWE82_07365 [Defluviitaleaceae bacterium]|nr:hypothetical protein [Defluviitaleaceae bacterium]